MGYYAFRGRCYEYKDDGDYRVYENSRDHDHMDMRATILEDKKNGVQRS